MFKRSFLPALVVVLTAAFCTAQVPARDHVFLIVEENHGFKSVIGNSAMPYFNSLAQKYGLATNYYANTHPSIGNYFMMTAGQLYTNDDNFTSTVDIDNIVRHMLSAGKTWKSYAEGLPYAGYTGGNTGYYLKRHNPFAYFSDVANSSSEKLNLVPFPQFLTDLGNGQVPNLAYIAPNIMDDAHNGTLQQADTWLSQYVPKILASPEFTNNGLLVITWDEAEDTDSTNGGGHVATLMIAPDGKGGYKSTTFYQHQSLLRTIMTALGMTSFPGAAGNAPAMAEFFNTSTTPAPSPAPTPSTAGSVTVSSPANGATVASPVNFVASASGGSYPITAMRVYVDNSSAYTTSTSSLNTSLPLAAGAHSVVVQAWNSAGQVFKQALTINVASGTSTPAPPPATAGVTISSPASGATVASPVNFVASASGGSYPITAMRVYVDNSSAYSTSASSLNTSLPLAAGAHSVVVQAWNSAGQVFKQALNLTVSGTIAPPTTGVTIQSPTNGSTSASPVHVLASAAAPSGRTISAMRVYVDYNSAYTVNAASIDTYLNLAPGTHSIIINAWDNTGAAYKSGEIITVN